jgi:hypothetical protein
MIIYGTGSKFGHVAIANWEGGEGTGELYVIETSPVFCF